MSLKAGRVGVAPDQVDEFGKINSEVTDAYTKQEADAKFETKTHASSTYETKSDAAALQPKTLAVPIEMLDGSKLTVESALQGLNTVLDKSSDVVFLDTYCTPASSSADVKIQGKVVFVNLTIAVKEAVPQYTQFLNGLPNLGNRVCNITLYGPDKAMIRAYATGTNLSPHSGGITVTGTYNASFIYII